MIVRDGHGNVIVGVGCKQDRKKNNSFTNIIEKNLDFWGGGAISSAYPSFLTPKAPEPISNVLYFFDGNGNCCPSGQACGDNPNN